MNRFIHTTAGVRDIFGDEYERKKILTDRISRLFGEYGYHYIQTPSMEFYPVFDKDKGTIHSSQLYKMIDREGHTLVLRPDFTPSIARAVSMYFAEETLPLRLCYRGNVFLNNTNYRGRLNESTEMGVELINHDAVEADAELIALSVEIMKASGLKDFQISIGNVGIFNAIAKEAGIDDENTEQLRHLLSIRNQFGAAELTDTLDIDKCFKKSLGRLAGLFGDVSVLEEAEELTDNVDALLGIERLKSVYKLLKEYGCSRYVSFDLGMLSSFSYYTGIIFQAVAYGSGDAVIKGGRYNRFIEKFGKRTAAIGFTTLVDSLLFALQRQELLPDVPGDGILLIYNLSHVKDAIRLAAEYRENSKKVTCMPLYDSTSKEEYVSFAKRNNCGTIIYLRSDGTYETVQVSEAAK